MATVTGAVVDARLGGKATGATVELMVRTENGMWASYSNMWTTELREDGSFRIGPVPAGCSYDLQVDEEGWQAMKKIGELSPGEERAVGKMVLHPPGVATRWAAQAAEDAGPRVPWDATVSGRVLDEEGNAASGVRVSTSAEGRWGRGVSDLKGRFERWRGCRGRGGDGGGRWMTSCMGRRRDAWRGDGGGGSIVAGAWGVDWESAAGVAGGAVVRRRSEGVGELKGKVVLVQIGVWPEGFEQQIGEMKDLYERFHGKGLEIVTIFQRVDAWDVEELVKEEKVPWMVGVDAESKRVGNGAMYAEMNGQVTLVVDRDGKVRRCVGWDVEGWVERLMGEKGN